MWEPAGIFTTQGEVWLGNVQARNQLYGDPTQEEVNTIAKALVLTPDDVVYLNKDEGHETNKYLRHIQRRLSPRLGNFLHKGFTSSDLLDTATALGIIRSIRIVTCDVASLANPVLDLAIRHKDTWQLARSHGQDAIIHTFGRQVVGWYAQLLRDLDRLNMAGEIIGYGKISGEVGTNVFIPPELEELTLANLGLKVDPAPTQVISRDRHSTVLSLLSENAGTIERIATDIRLLSMTAIGEVREPFEEAQQGSSAMPHKRNPELSERSCGLVRVIRGLAHAEKESTALWLARDISHSSVERIVLGDSFGYYGYITRLMTYVTEGLEVNPRRMLENLNRIYEAIYSPTLLNALMDKSLSRTEAYDLVKPLAQKALDDGLPLQELVRQNPRIVETLGEKLGDCFDPNFYLRNISVAYRRLGINLPC